MNLVLVPVDVQLYVSVYSVQLTTSNCGTNSYSHLLLVQGSQSIDGCCEG